MFPKCFFVTVFLIFNQESFCYILSIFVAQLGFKDLKMKNGEKSPLSCCCLIQLTGKLDFVGK